MCRDNALLKIAREAVTEKSKHSGVLNGRFRQLAVVQPEPIGWPLSTHSRLSQ